MALPYLQPGSASWPPISDAPERVGQSDDVLAKDTRTAIRRDGLEMFIASNRPGGLAPSGIGANDIWVSTRETTTDPWSTPVNLGRPVNSEFEDGAPALSWDGTAMYFYSRRPVGFGDRDLWATTRVKLDQS